MANKKPRNPKSWEECLTALGAFVKERAFHDELAARHRSTVVMLPEYLVSGEDVERLYDLAREAAGAMEDAVLVPSLDRGDSADPRHKAYRYVSSLIQAAADRVSELGKYRGEPADLFLSPEEYAQCFADAIACGDSNGPTSSRSMRTVSKSTEMKGLASTVVEAIMAETESDSGRTLTSILKSVGVSFETYRKSKHFREARESWKSLESKRNDNAHYRSEVIRRQDDEPECESEYEE